MRIVLDTLGGDNPPEEIIRGGLKAAEALGVEVLFAGDRTAIQRELSAASDHKYEFSVIHAPQAITMEDAPAEAVRRKKDSSLVQGIRAVRQGRADAFVSPANTGAVMAASLLGLGRIPGIERPGIGAVLPTTTGGQVLVIDVGANTDCTPENLCQFAVMGRVYAHQVLGVASPAVGLLNIGTERAKGNELVRKTRARLEHLPGFVGSVEPDHLLQGVVDVAVCDGFAGNILLKAYEGGAAATIEFLKQRLQGRPLVRLSALLLLPTLKAFKRELHSSRFGGAPLLGVRGVTVVAHGHSDAEAIKNAIGVAAHAVEQRLVQKIADGLQHLAPAQTQGQEVKL